MSSDRTRTLWKLVGLVAGAGVGLWLWRGGRDRGDAVRRWTGPGDAAYRIQGAFDRDPELAARVRVHAISDGVVELTGGVAARDQRDRAVAMAHSTPGVHTVVNRIVVEPEEARMAENRARNEDGPASRQHYGMGVGMGTRRQSPDTDPDRPSDRQKLVERELDVARMRDEPPARGGADGPPDAAAEEPAP